MPNSGAFFEMLAGNAVNQVHQVTFKHMNRELPVSCVSERFIIAFTKACQWTLLEPVEFIQILSGAIYFKINFSTLPPLV